MRGVAIFPTIRFHNLHKYARPAWRYRAWLHSCMERFALPSRFIRIEYYAVSRETIVELHKRFLDDDTPTDILTFDYGDAAEILICPEVIRENAQYYNTSFSEELRRVMIHGALHLCGLQDKTSSEEARMRAAEDFCLRAWKTSVSHETSRKGL
ncbi:MAG: rRNA maturation RNase YbeY [Bacteroidia bacterium]|nr:rRNA maturation RNase YbeY [Bacteroidia bacterium]MCX7764001.1 rRNA maturation RNase YbeY [Bacteroidia bacterium]MDW8056867.1 rRNA maturation RNase YbeY [Bacteroidia bacterium]